MTSLGNKEILSKNLKHYIEASGKDRRELAEIWGFPYSTVSDWINGKKYPRIDRIEVMADYFGILKSDLIEDKANEEKEKPSETEGLSENKMALMEYVKTVSEDQAAMLLRVIRSIVDSD